MRTPMALDDELVAEAQSLTGLMDEVRSGSRSAQGADRTRERPAAGPSRRKRAWRRRPRAVGRRERDAGRYIGLGRSPASGQPRACQITRPGRGLGASVRGRRNRARRPAPARAYFEGAFPLAFRRCRDARRGSAFHRGGRAVCARRRLRRCASSRRGPSHCRQLACGHTTSGCTNSPWGWVWRRSSHDTSNRNHPNRRHKTRFWSLLTPFSTNASTETYLAHSRSMYSRVW